ncbi:MAG: elongation factor 1-beta [Candidatus Aenigmarchaeota archaeon]|nr:elongation factor 1-beta [Candidatus Aenigmarchaeota archaeon]
MTGQVICVYRVLPKSPEEFENVKKAVETLKPQKIEEEPIAFGLKALIVTILIPEIEGKLEEFENKISSLDGVQSAENIRTSRSL